MFNSELGTSNPELVLRFAALKRHLRRQPDGTEADGHGAGVGRPLDVLAMRAGFEEINVVFLVAVGELVDIGFTEKFGEIIG